MELLKTYARNFVTCSILLVTLQVNVKSQNTGDNFKWQNHWFIGISGGPARSRISDDLTSSVSGAVTTRENSFSLSFEAGYSFSKYFGLSTGIGLSQYKTKLSLDTYSNSLDTVDSEGESYERRITGEDIKETRKIYFLEIPLILNFQCPVGGPVGIYVQGGISMAIPIGTDYSGSGIFSYKGYYPAYNVVLEDIPYEGFRNNVKNDVTGELNVKSVNFEFLTSGGLYYHNSKNFQISAGVFYKSMLSDISDYPPAGNFQISTHEGQLRSFMQGSNKTTANSMGILITLRYYLK
jgi:Outer membrane protein beta-barrel domain